MATGMQIQRLVTSYALLTVAPFVHSGVIPDDVVAAEDIATGTQVASQGHKHEIFAFTYGGIIEEPSEPLGFMSMARRGDATLETPISFTFSGVLEDEAVIEELEITRQIIVEAETVTQTPSFVHSSIPTDLHDLEVTRQVIVEAEPPPPTHVFLLDGVPLADVHDLEILRGVVVTAEPLPPTPSQLHAGVIPDDFVAEEVEITRQIVVAAEPIEIPPSLLFAGVIPDNVTPEFTQAFVQAEPLEIAASFLHSGVEIEELAVEEIATGTQISSQGHRFEQFAFTHGGLIAEPAEPLGFMSIARRGDATLEIPASFLHSGVEIEESDPAPEEVFRLYVEAEPLPPVHTFTHGTFLADDVAPVFAPEEAARVYVEAEPVHVPLSLLHGTFLADDVVPEDPPFSGAFVPYQSPEVLDYFALTVSINIEYEEPKADIVIVPFQPPLPNPPDSFVYQHVIPETNAMFGVGVEAEAIDQPRSFLLSGVPLEDVVTEPEGTQTALVVAEPLEIAPSWLQSGVAPADFLQGNPFVFVEAEPLHIPPSFVHAGVTALEDVHDLEIAREIRVAAEPLHVPASFVHAGVPLSDIDDLEIERKVSVEAHPLTLPPPSSLHSGVIPDDVIPPAPPFGTQVFVAAEDPLRGGVPATFVKVQIPPQTQLDLIEEKICEIWQDLGLDPDNPKTITEIVTDEQWEERVAAIVKDVVKLGNIVTITRRK